MDRNEVRSKLTEICRDILENEKLELTEETKASDVAGWDSLSHLSIINELEVVFDIAFSLDEATGAKNVGSLIDAVMKHLEEKTAG